MANSLGTQWPLGGQAIGLRQVFPTSSDSRHGKFMRFWSGLKTTQFAKAMEFGYDPHRLQPWESVQVEWPSHQVALTSRMRIISILDSKSREHWMMTPPGWVTHWLLVPFGTITNLFVKSLTMGNPHLRDVGTSKTSSFFAEARQLLTWIDQNCYRWYKKYVKIQSKDIQCCK